MNELNKHQFILLVILISFIVSLATAVSTVSLLENEPATIPMTINRIVERTIEKVVPGQSTGDNSVKKETEDELIAKATQINLPAVGTVMIRSWDVASEAKVPTGAGVLISDDLILTASGSLPERSDFFIRTSDGALYEVSPVTKDTASGIGILAFKDKTKITKLPHATFAVGLPEVGDTVFAIGGKEKRAIRRGIVSSLDAVGNDGGADQVISKIRTTADLIMQDSGGPLLNLRGELLGINIVTREEHYTVPVQILLGLTKSVGSAGGR